MTRIDRKSNVIADADWTLLEEICRKAGVPTRIVVEMLDCESRVFGMGRRHGIREKLQELISEGVRDTRTPGKDGVS